MHQDTVCTKRLSQDPTSSMFIQSRAAQWQPSFETVLRDSLAGQSCAAQRQPSSERRAQPIPNTRAKYKKKSTKGIPFLGIKLWKRTPKLIESDALKREPSTFLRTDHRHFTQMILSFGNHEIADDDEIQTQHFGFTLFVPFWFKIKTSGLSHPVMCGLTSQD